MLVFSAVTALALQVGGAIPDTVVTVPATSFTHTLGTIASAILALAVFIIALALGVAAWQIKKLFDRVTIFIDRVTLDVGPLAKRAMTVVEEAGDITKTVKKKVHDVEKTVDYANEKFRDAVDGTSDRIGQFNTMVKTMQDEANDALISTVSTVRGVRSGIREVFRRKSSRHTTRQDDDDIRERQSSDSYAGPRIKPKEDTDDAEEEIA